MNNQLVKNSVIGVVLLLLLAGVVIGLDKCIHFGNQYGIEYSGASNDVEIASGALGGAIGFGLFASVALYGFVKVFLAWIK